MESDTIKVLIIDGPPYIKGKEIDVASSCLKTMKFFVYLQKENYKGVFNIQSDGDKYTGSFSHNFSQTINHGNTKL